MTTRAGATHLACVVAATALAPVSSGASDITDTKVIVAVAGTSPAGAAAAPPDPAQVKPATIDAGASGISGNAAAGNIVTGTGQLGSALGLDPDSGVRIGGVWVANANVLLSGGDKPGQSSFNSLLLADLNLDFAKLANIPGAQVGAQFLQFDGQPTNQEAGVVTGYNSLTGLPPFNRSELYQLWWRQSLFDDRLVVRIGKSVPTYDFNNVARPVRTRDESLMIPSVTGLIYTPAFVNTTLLGVMPGYYNSAYGVTATLAPTESLYLSYGAYDGSGVRRQTGLSTVPEFSGYYFHIAETGYSWILGSGTLPGGVAVGGWHQTGKLAIPADGLSENGASGFYTFGSQRLWNRHPDRELSGISGFFQFGANDSRTLVAHRYFGVGATGFGLIPGRPADTVGIGLARSWLNQSAGFRGNETIFAAYYQAKILDNLFAQPVITYVPDPGASPGRKPVTALTLQTTILF